ncbi:MAG: lipoyl(octanoyl) transferase LipB, partial [Pseudonocardiaceae bacterium]
YTAGRRTTPDERPHDSTPVIDVDRGGKITWHGPGQLVGYPVIALAEPLDVLDYVRRLERALIAVCTELGLGTQRIPGRSGVWLAAEPATGRPDRKLAAIGVRVSRGVTMHGFALNCQPDLTAFDRIVPCGITDAGVTSLTAELGRPVSVAQVLPSVSSAVLEALDSAPTQPLPGSGQPW